MRTGRGRLNEHSNDGEINESSNDGEMQNPWGERQPCP